MINEKYYKQIVVFTMALVIAVTNAATLNAKKITDTTYTFYDKNETKIKTKKIVKGKAVGSSQAAGSKQKIELMSVELIKFNRKTVAVSSSAIVYGKKSKKLSATNYVYKKGVKLKKKRQYFYSTHKKAKNPKALSKVYASRTYNKYGSTKAVKYHTKDGKQQEVATHAKKQIGKRYVSGGTTPRGFDCSGLTKYVYKKSINKNISRTSYSQAKSKGKYVKVSKSKLQPGDLLFWGSRSMPYHVGVYVGKGKYVHASTPRTGVETRKLNSFKPSFAKRIVAE